MLQGANGRLWAPAVRRLLAAGTQDPLIPLAAGRELARRIPGARVVVHEGTGHALFERTEKVSKSILAFLADCEAPASASPDDTDRRANT
jgi:pimeloyl-ACP methyl ester carboxylesterase